MIRTNAALFLIQKEVYDAQQAVLPDALEEDVQLVNNPDGSNEPDTSNSQKDTGHPTPPKVVHPTPQKGREHVDARES